jgi:pyruvate formate lyase activating enzyme
MGLVFNIQRYSTQDGPGIRTVVFLKGCPLRCWWCSNPESQQPYPEVGHSDSLCNQCQLCVSSCKINAITMDKNRGIRIDRKLCINCGACVEVCPLQAIKVYGQEMTVKEVLQIVEKDRIFYHNSGGGVTASGGEPLCQPDFVADLFQICLDKGIHTVLETCGCVDIGNIEKVLPYTRLVLYDIKHADSKVHKKVTGRSNEQIIRNFEFIARKGVPLAVRVPLIPGINDTDEDIKSIAHIITEYMSEPKVELMPYHRYGMGKYQMLDRRYKLNKLVPQGGDDLERIKSVFKSSGVEPSILG